MSNDLISRQAAIKNLAGIAKNCARPDPQMALMGRCIYMIENMSSVQPEQKPAHWYSPCDYDPPEWCSNCHTRTRWAFDDGYCPNCGAKMESDDGSEGKQ